MKITDSVKSTVGNRILVTTEELRELRGGCGRQAATRIGEAASARVSVGRRVFWSVPKITEYLKKVAE